MNQNKCSSVEITEDEISEFDGNKRIVSIHRKDIIKIVLKYGVIGERYLVQIICGLILTALGLVFGSLPIYHILKTGVSLSGPALGVIASAAPMVLVGIFLIAGLFKRRYYLLIQTGGKHRKVVFQDKIELPEISHFINTINSNLKYEIATDSELKL